MIVFPPCKINLGLYVTGKRDDGFHSISSVFYPISLCDALEVIPSEGESGDFSFSSSGIPIPGDESNNLVIKAYRLLDALYGLPAVKIHLHKVIPMGAGLGGGSSDGAWMLRLLNDLFQLNLNQETLIPIAAQLGSDCPFFIFDSACKVSGRGEVLEPIDVDLSKYLLWIVNPGTHVSTANAFQNVNMAQAPSRWEDSISESPEKWNFKNVFEENVGALYPEILAVKQTLLNQGAIYASMTGSGSTVYGIFEKKPDIEGIFPNYLSLVI